MLETTQNHFLLITDTVEWAVATDTVTVFLLPCNGFCTYPPSQPYQEVQAENRHSHIKLLTSS